MNVRCWEKKDWGEPCSVCGTAMGRPLSVSIRHVERDLGWILKNGHDPSRNAEWAERIKREIPLMAATERQLAVLRYKAHDWFKRGHGRKLIRDAWHQERDLKWELAERLTEVVRERDLLLWEKRETKP